jgi:histidine phosphotransferase ChpT
MPELAQQPDVKLTRMLAARITHDLSGPLGTLMAAAGNPAGAALMAETLEVMRVRLRLYGAVFGPADALDWEAMRELLAGAPGAHRIKFALQPQSNAPPSAGMAQLLLAALMLAAEALPRGGTVTLLGDGSAPYMLLPEGPMARWPHGFIDVLAGGQPAEAGTPRGVLAAWVPAMAQAARARISLGQGPGAVPPLLVQPALH